MVLERSEWEESRPKMPYFQTSKRRKLGFEHHRHQFLVSDNKGERNSEIREKNFSPCTK
jgi:hypothetical protein